jgi:phosphate uptake regulator
MELRKVQLTGGSSLTVTLPKSWAEKVDLQAGDVVGCTEQPDGSMAIHPHAKGEREIQRHQVSADGTDGEDLFRRIIAAYLSGFDAVDVSSVDGIDATDRDGVRRAVTRIMGLEITEEAESSITVQDFLDPKDFHVDKAIRRILMLTRAMQAGADDLLADPSRDDLLETIEGRDDEVDRLFWLVNKQFHALLRDVSYASEMEISPSEALNYLLVARMSERTADHAARVAREAGRIPRDEGNDELIDDLGASWRRATSLYTDAMETFRKSEPDRADEVIARAGAMQDEQADLLRRATECGPEAVAHLAFVIESIGRTAAYAANIAEVAINHDVATV